MSTGIPQIFPLVLTAAALSVPARSDVLLEQPHDFNSYHWSYNPGSGLLTGDDYRPEEPVIIETAIFWMVGSWPNTPYLWQMEIYETFQVEYHWPWRYTPAFWPLFRMIGQSEVIDLGPWNGDESLHLFEVRFENINQRLDPGPLDGEEDYIDGIYWISCAGFLADTRQGDRSFWGTAGNGHINGDTGWFKLESSWMPLQGDERSDFAMRLEGRRAGAADEDDANNTEVEVTYGRHFDGGLREIRYSDGMHLVGISHPYRGGHRTEFIVRARTTVENPQTLDLTMQAKIRRSTGGDVLGFQNAYMWNWKTGRFDSLGQYWIWGYPLVLPFRDLDASQYINVDCEMEVLITHENDMSRFNIAFLSFIDRVQIEVTGAKE